MEIMEKRSEEKKRIRTEKALALGWPCMAGPPNA